MSRRFRKQRSRGVVRRPAVFPESSLSSLRTAARTARATPGEKLGRAERNGSARCVTSRLPFFSLCTRPILVDERFRRRFFFFAPQTRARKGKSPERRETSTFLVSLEFGAYSSLYTTCWQVRTLSTCGSILDVTLCFNPDFDWLINRFMGLANSHLEMCIQ